MFNLEVKPAQYDRLRVMVSAEDIKSLNSDFFENRNNLCLKSQIPEKVIGLNQITVTEAQDGVIIDITGKINAKKGDLGLIDKNNIEIALNKVKNIGAVDFNVNDVINHGKVLYLDATKDVEVENPIETIEAIRLFTESKSKKFKTLNYPNKGLLIKPYAKYAKDSIVAYLKYNEILSNKSPKNKGYIEKVGYEALEGLKNIVRAERHLSSFGALRKALQTDEKEIRLCTALETKENLLHNRFNEVTETAEYPGFRGIEVF